MTDQVFNSTLHYQMHHAIHGPQRKWWFGTLVRHIPSAICRVVHWPFCLIAGHYWSDFFVIRYTHIKDSHGGGRYEACHYCGTRKR